MKSNNLFLVVWLLAPAAFHIHVRATGQVVDVDTSILVTPGTETNNTTDRGQGQFQNLTPWNIQDQSVTDPGDEMDPPAPRGAGGVLAEPSALVQPTQVSNLTGQSQCIPVAQAPALDSQGFPVLDGHWQKGYFFMLIENGQARLFEKEVTGAMAEPIQMMGPHDVQLGIPRNLIRGKWSQTDGVQQLVFPQPIGVYHKLPALNIIDGPKHQVGVLNGRWQSRNGIIDIADGKVTLYDKGKTANTGEARYDGEFKCELTLKGLGAVEARIQASNKLTVLGAGTWYKFPPDLRAQYPGKWEWKRGFLVLENKDAFGGQNHEIRHDGRMRNRLKCQTDADLRRCESACKDAAGVGAFVIYDGFCYFRHKSWTTCEENQEDVQGAILYLYTKKWAEPTVVVQPRRRPAREAEAVPTPRDERPGDGTLVLKGRDAVAGENHGSRARYQVQWEWKKGFLMLKDTDAFGGENHKIFHDGKTRDRLKCRTDDDLRRCKLACKDAPGVEAFVKYDGFCYFRHKPWRTCGENREDAPGAILYLHTKTRADPTVFVQPRRRPAKAKAVPAPRDERPGDGFLVLKGKDAFAGDNHDVRYDGEWKKTMPCNTDDDLRRCKLACKDTAGVEAFTVFEGTAYFRGKPWKKCQSNQKNVPGAILYLNTRARARRTATKAVDHGFRVLEGKDAFAGENHVVLYDGQQKNTLPCITAYDLMRCRLACKDTPGVEAFVVFEGTAYFRGRPWKECEDNQKDVPGATLYLYTKAPVAADTTPNVSAVPAAVVQPRSNPAVEAGPAAVVQPSRSPAAEAKDDQDAVD